MGFYRRIKYFLVHTLFLSNKEAQVLIDTGKVEIDGCVVSENCLLADHAEIKVNGKTVRAGTQLVYLAFNKPVGFESTLNPAVTGNLSSFFSGFKNLSIAGRLDKASEGLLLLSNDGKWVQNLCDPASGKEKEYIVTLNQDPDHNFIDSFKRGVNIGGYLTKPCGCIHTGSGIISVTLTEGKNRQIRRMCGALGYKVIKLLRVRVDRFELNDLKAGEYTVIKI